ncbi:MAG: immunoglobulin domain-containing protein, partial [Lacunisphaera sp.]
MKTNSLSCVFRFLFGSVLFLTKFASAQTVAQTQYYFTTFAGASSAGSSDGVGSSARFNQPLGCATDGAGNTYIADTFNHTIRKVSSTGVTTTVAGKPGVSGSDDGTGGAARFNRPTGIVVDSTGTIFAVDSDSRKIRKISPAGVVTTLPVNLAGAPNPGSPYAVNSVGLALDAAGNLYTADSAEYVVQKITPSGIVTTVAGIMGQRGSVDGSVSQAQLSPTGGIAIDGSGIIYITENFSIRKITPGGNVSILTGVEDGTGTPASFANPKGVTIDTAGNLFVADSNDSAVRKINPSGGVTTFAGNLTKSGDDDGTGTDATFIGPSSIALDLAGNFLVTDSGTNTLRRISPAGQVTTLAGLSPEKSNGSVDGIGSAARFNSPTGMAISSTGDIYVADSGNGTIRKIAPSGVVTTVAGLAGQPGYLDGPVTAALFFDPTCVVIDSSANLIVNDYGNALIRKISPAGIVTTVASQPLVGRILDLAVDGPGNIYVTESSALQKIDLTGTVSTLESFTPIQGLFKGIAFDPSGNLYWSDLDASALFQLPVDSIGPNSIPTQARFPSGNAVGAIFVDGMGQIFGTDVPYFGDSRVFKAKMDGSIQTIGGQLYAWGNTDGIGAAALFNRPRGIVADGAGNIYVSCLDNTIRKGVPAGPPVIATQPQNVTVAVNNSVQFSVAGGGVPEPTYQWYFNGTAFSGATSNTLSFANARSTDAGDYTVVVTNELGSITSIKATLTVSASPTSTTGTATTPSGGGGSL